MRDPRLVGSPVDEPPKFDISTFDDDEFFAVTALFGQIPNAKHENVVRWQNLSLGMSEADIKAKSVVGCRKLEVRGYLKRTGPEDSNGYIPYVTAGILITPAKFVSAMTPEEKARALGPSAGKRS